MMKQLDHKSYLRLGVAAALLLFANGRWIIPVAAWLAPVFMLRYLRDEKPLKGLLIGYSVIVTTFFITWYGMIPMPTKYFYMMGPLIGIYLILSYVLDRLLAPRFGGFLATLVFPVAWVTVDFVNAKFSPYGHWGLTAYTQHGNLPLLQVLSITGIWGVTFIVVWFASVANWVWEQKFEWRPIRTGAAVYIGILVAVLFFGGARLTLFPPEAKTVRIASVSAPIARASVSAIAEEEPDSRAINNSRIHDTLFELSKIGVRSGAKMVLWPEANAQVEKEDESDLIERGRKWAQDEGIYLSMALFTNIPGQYLRENKTITIDPNGDIISTYLKSRPPPGEPSVIGDGIIPVMATPFGKISSVICSDMDSPFHLRQRAVQAGIDIMLAPSWDWKEIDPYHTWMTVFRGIENGFSVVRQTNDGLSSATDYQGNILASMDHYTTEEHVMISQVPTKGVTTVYAQIGDVFAWLCLAALALMVTSAVRNKVREEASKSGAGGKRQPT